LQRAIAPRHQLPPEPGIKHRFNLNSRLPRLFFFCSTAEPDLNYCRSTPAHAHLRDAWQFRDQVQRFVLPHIATALDSPRRWPAVAQAARPREL